MSRKLIDALGGGDNYILQDAAKNLGWRRDDKDEPIDAYLDILARLEPREIFDRYCNWQGLVRWGWGLYGTVLELEAAALKEREEA